MLSFSAEQNEKSQAFEGLQESAEPLPFEEISPVIQANWQCELDQVVKHIEHHGKAASLGQVHRAQLLDGQEVAIKVQYPGIRKAIVSDMKMLGWLSLPMGNLNQGFDLKGYRSVIMDDLDEELDYRQEATNQQEFLKNNATSDFVIVPEVNTELSSETILVTTWENGDTWEEVKQNWPAETKQLLGKRLLAWFLESLFDHGLLHADLHPGNLRFVYHAKHPKIVLYDYGSVYRPTTEKRMALLRLIQAAMHQHGSPLGLMVALGFSEEFLSPLSKKLPSLCRVLFEPFCVEYPYGVERWNLSTRVSDILGNDRLNFRVAGPPDLIFLLRAFHSIKNYLQGLNADVSWQRLIQPLINQYAIPIAQVKIPVTQSKDDFSSMAKHLKIRVSRNNQVKAEITAYASGIDRLDQLLDDDVKQKIAEQNLDLEKIVAEVRARGYTPGPVFNFEETDKEIKVWLE
ncbi:MAG: ABC1 kinase family protein [Pirellulales bacterium]